MNAEYRHSLRNNMLKALVSEKDKSVKLKICDVITQVAHNIYETKEKWEELLTYISTTLTTPLTQENVVEAESALFIIKNIFAYDHIEILKGVNVLINVFSSYFKTNNLDLKTRTVETVAEILCIVDKKNTKLLKDFIFSMLETTYACLQNPKEETNVKILLLTIFS